MEEAQTRITKWKKPVWKGFTLYDSNFLTFWRKQNYGVSKKIRGCREEGMNRWSTDDFYGSENTLYGTIILDTCALYVGPNM